MSRGQGRKRLVAGNLAGTMVLDWDDYYTVERMRSGGISRELLMVTRDRYRALGYLAELSERPSTNNQAPGGGLAMEGTR